MTSELAALSGLKTAKMRPKVVPLTYDFIEQFQDVTD